MTFGAALAKVGVEPNLTKLNVSWLNPTYLTCRGALEN